MRKISSYHTSSKATKIKRTRSPRQPIPRRPPSRVLLSNKYASRPIPIGTRETWRADKAEYELSIKNQAIRAVDGRDSPEINSSRSFVLNSKNMSRMGGSLTDQLSSTIGLFKSTITDADRYYFYTRDELFNQAVEKRTGALTNKWFKIKLVKPNEADHKFIEITEKMFRDINYNHFLKKACTWSFVYGVGWIGINYKEKVRDISQDTLTTNADLDVRKWSKEAQVGESVNVQGVHFEIKEEEITIKGEKEKKRLLVCNALAGEPKNAVDVSFLNIIENKDIDVNTTDDDRRSDNYGAPETYKVSYDNAFGLYGDREVIHYKRILRVVLLPQGDDIKGMSMVDPVFDKGLVKKRMDFNIGDIYWRMAEPLMEVITPNDKTAFDTATQDFGEDGFSSRRVWIHKREGNDPKASMWEIKLISAEGNVLQPGDFYEKTVNPFIAGTGVPDDIVRGAAGATQGNETNLKSFYSGISDKQNNTLTPLTRSFITWMQESGIYKEKGWDKDIPDYIIEWNPVFELTAKELAQQQLMLARKHEIYGELGAMTVDEIREDLGKPALTPKQKEGISGMNGEPEAPENPEDPEEPANPAQKKKEISAKIPFSPHQNVAEDEVLEILVEGDNNQLDNYLLSEEV